MEMQIARTNVHALTITRVDALDAGLVLIGNGQTRKEIGSNDRLANGTLNSYLFESLRAGWLRDDIEAFRADIYSRAEESGLVVNRKSNSVLTATSRCATFADRADRFEFLNVASNLGECLKLAKARDERVEAQEKAAKQAQADQEQAEQNQRKRDEAAMLVEQSIEADKLSGKYASDMLEAIQVLIEKLGEVGVVRVLIDPAAQVEAPTKGKRK